MRTIYTSVKGLVIPDVIVEHYTKLPAVQRIWIEARMQQLLATPTVPERKAARIIAKEAEKPVRQAFFCIRGRSYFLDLFLPKMMLAIEIDGSSHDKRKTHDRRRDADFRSVGIRTIRVKNRDVMEGNLIEKLYNRLFV